MANAGKDDGGRQQITVRVVFGSSKMSDNESYSFKVEVNRDGSDSIFDVKQLVADAAGGNIAPGDLLLTFGPNDRKIGKQYKGDPTVDERKLRLSDFSVLSWLQRFPHWTLLARLLPGAPPPPGKYENPLPFASQTVFSNTIISQMILFLLTGVAIKQAAALAEQKDPDRAIQDGRAKGEIPKISDLPAPWGPKPYIAPPEQQLVQSGYLPAKYPEGSSPLVDAK